jgi:hypothetical protein
LEQLAEELAAANVDGTLPEVLAPEQVRVQANGAMQLLDLPIDSRPPGSLSLSPQERSLSLLRQVALVMLEGRLSTGKSAQGVRAPLPEHASQLLAGLLGPQQPYREVGGLKEKLVATKELPTRVTTGMRAGHLAVMTALLAIGILPMLAVSIGYGGLLVDVVSSQLAGQQQILHLQDRERLKDYLDQQYQAEQSVPRTEIEKRYADPSFESSIREAAANYRSQLAARKARLTALDRWLWHAEYERATQLMSQETMAPQENFTPDALVEAADSAAAPPMLILGFMAVAMVFAVVLFPLAWTVWPLLVGPGFSYQIAGLSLVQLDGRPANRLQCAWRALLVWGPIGALLATSLILQTFFIELGVLCIAPVWAAAALLVAYVLLALWYRRGACTMCSRGHGWCRGNTCAAYPAWAS